MNQRTKQGFSLIEVLIAIFIIAVGVLGVTTTLWWGFNASEQGSRMAEASNHARVLMEAIMGQNLLNNDTGWVTQTGNFYEPDASLDSRPFVDAPPFVETLDIPPDARERYRRRITAERLSSDNTQYEYFLARVRVRVFWQERGVERSVELVGVEPVNVP